MNYRVQPKALSAVRCYSCRRACHAAYSAHQSQVGNSMQAAMHPAQIYPAKGRLVSHSYTSSSKKPHLVQEVSKTGPCWRARLESGLAAGLIACQLLCAGPSLAANTPFLSSTGTQSATSPPPSFDYMLLLQSASKALLQYLTFKIPVEQSSTEVLPDEQVQRAP